MNYACADMSFGLNGQALAVAQFLAKREPDFANWREDQHCYDIYHISTFPWYNGRETGVLFCLTPFLTSKTLIIAVFEHRNCDNICAVSCLHDTFMLNSPSPEEIISKLYNHEETSVPSNMVNVPYGSVGEMAQKVYNLMSEYYIEEVEKQMEIVNG